MKKGQFWLVIQIIFWIFFIFVAGVYVQVSQQKPIPSQVKIGVTYMTMNTEFYRILHTEIHRKADEDGDLLLVRNPEMDEEKQSQQIDYFREQKVDVLIINPIRGDSPPILQALKRAKDAGIRIIAVDSQLKDFPVDTSVVSDNYQAGVLVAKDLLKRRSQADILLLTHKGTVSADQRIQGFLDTIASHPSFRIISQRETLGQTERAMPEVLDVIRLGTSFDTLVALNDRVAIGALAAIKEQALSSPILIYGIDGSPDMKNLLSSTKDVTATIAQSPMTMGKTVMQAVEKLTKGQAVKKVYTIPVELVDKENIHQYDISGWQ